ncbi:MAG: DNA polymerase III subunit alpha [Nitrospirota bacterium]|nr:DNA polymerase III subunit alpha [Nitrospirota bacterium]
MSSFVHLHVHSEYSPMQGISTLEALCQTARGHGAETLALTDTNGLYGAIRFIEVAQAHGLRPILGAELTHNRHRAVLLVKDSFGYTNLCRLLSQRHCDADFDCITSVQEHRQGLIILSDDLPALTAWKRHSPTDLYVELSPGALMHQALAFSRRAHLPPVATNRVHFVTPQEFPLHQILRAIALNTTLSQLPPDACCAPNHWLMPPATLAPQFPHVPHAMTNTWKIAQHCQTEWSFKATIFPGFRQLSDPHAFTMLREKTYDGARWRYGSLTPVVTDRIERELGVIRDKSYAHYFLVVDEIVRQAPRTCGRGSAAASIVSYCLGITHVDPIRHNLFFERFLNPGRHDPPDIDVDFPWDERDRIVDFVFARYGSRQAGMVANQNTLALRAAVREVAKVYGMPPGEIQQVSQLLARLPLTELPVHQVPASPCSQSVSRNARPHSIREKESPRPSPSSTPHNGNRKNSHLDGASAFTDLRNPWPAIISLALQLQGRFRHLSLHCGGIVIVPDDLRRYVPVEVSAKGIPVIQWEKDQTEDAGLVKIDLLGNRSLAVIRDAIAAIAANTGHHIDYATWDPLTDHKTQQLIQRGETIGCFYIESPATRLLLKKLWTGMPADRRARADVFEYLIIVSSLIRPAANRFIQEFVRRAHGGACRPLHPLVEGVLVKTHGIMVYQEDVTKVAMGLAGFSVEDGDQLRKILSKKHKQRQLRDYQRQFVDGARARGVDARTIERVWAMTMSFAGYSFCKPHSASYAQVSFKSAYLRAHYPAEFMAAVISNQGGFYSTFAYLSEARRMGLTILPPDINASAWAYEGAGTTIRMGFMQMKGLARGFVDRLLEERHRHGAFQSFHDFLTRLHPEPAQIRLLILAGCFDTIAGEVTRPGLLWRVYAEHPTCGISARSATQHATPLLPTARLLPIPNEYSPERMIQHEIELFGFPLRCHPLTLYAKHLQGLRIIPAIEMAAHIGRRIMMVGWLITEKTASTRHGEPMEFITLEDTTELYDATLFPDTFQRYGPLLTNERPLLLKGLVEEDFTATTLTVHHIQVIG